MHLQGAPAFSEEAFREKLAGVVDERTLRHLLKAPREPRRGCTRWPCRCRVRRRGIEE